MSASCLSQNELAVRWELSPRTLERWRQHGSGPAFFPAGNRAVRYRFADIEAFEAERLRVRTTEALDAGSAGEVQA